MGIFITKSDDTVVHEEKSENPWTQHFRDFLKEKGYKKLGEVPRENLSDFFNELKKSYSDLTDSDIEELKKQEG